MCKLGDIIVVKEFKDKNSKIVPMHSFVVINDESGIIQGYSYDLVCNVMCRFHSRKHRRKKLKYKSNLEINPKDVSGNNINNKSGYIRVDDLFYFKKNKIKYKVIGHINDEFKKKLLNLSFELINKNKTHRILNNL